MNALDHLGQFLLGHTGCIVLLVTVIYYQNLNSSPLKMGHKMHEELKTKIFILSPHTKCVLLVLSFLLRAANCPFLIGIVVNKIYRLRF